MQKNILFDLDGTLLPMDLPKFIELYMQAFCRCFSHQVQLSPKLLAEGIWNGAAAMSKNDGDCLNRKLFWRAMNHTCNKDMRVYEDAFDDFYRNEFVAAKEATSVNPAVAETVALLKACGCKLTVATNPIFPKAATYTRIRWAGLDPNDFDFITVYDNCSYCKPNLNYYFDICSLCGISPEDSLMVGNDIDEDMCAAKLGFNTFLITDCLINRRGKDIDRYRHGSFEDFYQYVTEQTLAHVRKADAV